MAMGRATHQAEQAAKPRGRGWRAQDTFQKHPGGQWAGDEPGAVALVGRVRSSLKAKVTGKREVSSSAKT